MADHGFVDFESPIPVHVSGFGHRSLGLAGKHGDGAVLSGVLDPNVMEIIWAAIEAGAAEVGRVIDRESFRTTLLTTIVMLRPGEPVDSPRVVAQADAFAIAGLHYAYDQWRNYGKTPGSPAILEVWDDYVAQMQEVPDEVRHQRIHRGHNCWVEPDEARFVTPALIESTCLVGTADQLRARLADFERAGLDEIILLPPLATRDDVLRDAAAALMAISD